MAGIGAILAERGKRYGNFEDQALISQKLKAIVTSAMGHALFAPDQHEALQMFCTKMARIINGDPNYIDNWDDIAGYATLVADRLRAEKKDGS